MKQHAVLAMESKNRRASTASDACVFWGFIPECYLIMSDSVRLFMFCAVLSRRYSVEGRRKNVLFI